MEHEYRFEMHYHTKEASPCAVMAAEDGIRQYKAEGYDGIIVTDHFNADVEGRSGQCSWQEAADRFLGGYSAAKKTGDDCGLAVFLGAEMRFPENYNDYLLLGLTEELIRENEWVYEKSLPEFYEFVKQHQLFLIQAHPFRSVCTPADPRFLDGVEVFNGHKGHDSHNDLAAAFARDNGLVPIVGSDCHDRHAIGTTAVYFKQMPQSTAQIIALLKQGDYRMETGRK